MSRLPFALLLLVALGSSVRSQDGPASPFADTVSQYFGRWDTNRDGTLSAGELDAAVLDRRYSADAAVAVAVLKQITTNPKYDAPKLTRDAVQKLPDRPAQKDVPGVDALFAAGLDRVANRNTSLFESGRPRLETIRQGTAGNCFCLAPIGGLVARDAVVVARMFQPWSGGGYRVAFADGRSAVVPPLTDAELVLAGSNGGDGRWVEVYEKAVAEVLNTDKAGKPKAAVALDATTRGGATAPVMRLLTGHKVRVVWCQPPAESKITAITPAELKKLFSENAGKRLICTGTAAGVTVPELAPSHAYAVLGFDGRSSAVKLWNPHGKTFTPTGPAGPKNGYPTADGAFSVPLDEFAKLFEEVLVETTEPATK